jgi:DNA-binding transcriptional ArsR family regulator
MDSFAVLAEPTRRRILDELRTAESSVGDLVSALLATVDEWLAPYRRMWTNRLDALERHLDSME